jgi:hypothetical protein
MKLFCGITPSNRSLSWRLGSPFGFVPAVLGPKVIFSKTHCEFLEEVTTQMTLRRGANMEESKILVQTKANEVKR